VPPSATDEKKWERALAAARPVQGGTASEHRSTEFPGKQAIKQSQHRLTPEEIREIGEEYQADLSIRQLAEKWQINRETVRLALKRAGVDARKPKALTDLELQEARALYEGGTSLNRLGRIYGIDPKTMKRRLDV